MAENACTERLAKRGTLRTRRKSCPRQGLRTALQRARREGGQRRDHNQPDIGVRPHRLGHIDSMRKAHLGGGPPIHPHQIPRGPCRPREQRWQPPRNARPSQTTSKTKMAPTSPRIPAAESTRRLQHKPAKRAQSPLRSMRRITNRTGTAGVCVAKGHLGSEWQVIDTARSNPQLAAQSKRCSQGQAQVLPPYGSRG